MDTKDFRGLMEAYSQVYAPQENIDEGLRSAVKRLLGGGKKEAEAPKPESRGEQLRKKYNVGPEKSDTSAKRQILNRSRARAERDERDYGDSKYSKSVAQKSKAAHERYLKAGYSKYGADDARGSGNKARKRAAALNREEFEFIVNSLIEEGYDLSSYTWDEMYDICLDEAVKGADLEMRKAASVERRGGDKRLSPSKGKGYAAHAMQQAAYVDKKTKGKHIPGYAYAEELDIFDVVLEFLQAEGYAETLEEAEWMMANELDSEDIEAIVEAEGSYGETPKAYSAASRTKMTAKRKPFLKAMQRRTNPANRKDAYSSPRKGMTASDREEARAGAAYGSPRGHDYPSQGPGGITKNPKKLRKQKAMGEFAKEDFELWIDSLVEEGYDLSEYTWDEMYDIYEAEGSYGETPKAYSAAFKTKMTAKRKPFLKAMLRRTNPAERKDAYGSPRKGLTADDRERARAGSAHGVGTRQDHDYPSEGPGGVTKNPKKLRKQKAMGEHG